MVVNNILSELTSAAVTLTEFCIPVILIQPGLKIPIPRPSDNSWWMITDPDDAPVIIKQASMNHGCLNLAVALGGQKGSPIIAASADMYKPEGKEAAALLKSLGVSTGSNVWVVRTGRGGITVFYFYDGQPLERQAATQNPGLDLMSNGFSLIPPSSTHKLAGGGPYTWIPNHSPTEIPLAELDNPPAALIDYWQGLKHKTGTPIQSADNDIIPEGQRDNALFKRASRYRGLGMSQAEIEAALLVYNQEHCRPPLSDNDVIQKAQSASKYFPNPSKFQSVPYDPSRDIVEDK